MSSTLGRTVVPSPISTCTAGQRILTISAEQKSRLDAAIDGDSAAAAAFDTALSTDPVLLDVEVLSTKRVRAGAGVSYGHTYRTSRPTTLARVAIGYGHGMPRKAGNLVSVAWVPHDGEPVRLPIVGRVAMDEFVVDADDVAVQPGAFIRVFGDARGGVPSLLEWAGLLGEMPVSIVACLDSRVERRIR